MALCAGALDQRLPLFGYDTCEFDEYGHLRNKTDYDYGDEYVTGNTTVNNTTINPVIFKNAAVIYKEMKKDMEGLSKAEQRFVVKAQFGTITDKDIDSIF